MKLYSIILLAILFPTFSGLATNDAPMYIKTKDVPKYRSVEGIETKGHTMAGALANLASQQFSDSVSSVYDVVVIGSDPEGIAAAVAAAREGQKTLLIDKRPIVGGLYTLGMLNMLDVNWSTTNESLNKGIFLEFFQKVNNRTSFDVKLAQKVFEEMLRNEKNITVQLGTQSILPIMKRNRVAALLYKDKKGMVKKVVGKQYIDSTPDADFAQLAGANFTIGQEDYRGEAKMMAVTLVFELSGVDWKKVHDNLNNDEEFYTGADQYSAWGYGKEMERYKSSHDNVRIRALNIGKQNNGHVLINAFQILGANGLNTVEVQEARNTANDELPKITQFLRENLVGFRNVRLVRTADEFYIRETRHLEAEYRLTIDDVLENRDFVDRIAFGGYPIDVQATVLGEGDVIIGNPEQYAIPFRSIVPRGFDNLLVASRSAGYESLAHGSARTVPVGMTIGQAAGITSAYANQNMIDFQKIVKDENHLHIRAIQAILNKNGANLHPIPQYNNPIMTHWAYDGVKFLRSYGLIEAGYDNEYNMEAALTKKDFTKYVTKLEQYTGSTFLVHFPFLENNQALTKEDLLEFLQANNLAVDNLTPMTKEKLLKRTVVERAVAYMSIKEFFEIKSGSGSTPR